MEIESLMEYSAVRKGSPVPQSKLRGRDSKYYLDLLFPEHKLLSLGSWLADFRTGFANEFIGDLPYLGLVVPAYMLKRSGMTLKDPFNKTILPHSSPRCNDNTGPLEYVMYRGFGGLNEQARGIIRVAGRYRLAMVVHATPDVLEAWFPVRGWKEANIKKLQKFAMAHGSWGKTQSRCHPYALPEGVTFDGRRKQYGSTQSVIYLDLAALSPVITR